MSSMYETINLFVLNCILNANIQNIIHAFYICIIRCEDTHTTNRYKYDRIINFEKYLTYENWRKLNLSVKCILPFQF